MTTTTRQVADVDPSNASHFIGVRFSVVGLDLPPQAVESSIRGMLARIDQPGSDIPRVITDGCNDMLRFRGAFNAAAFMCFGPRPVVVIYDARDRAACKPIDLTGGPLTSSHDPRISALVDAWAIENQHRAM